MSKGDGNRDETPIKFYIPRVSARGRAPIPINQPNWKYSSNTPPGAAEWVSTVIIDFVGVVAIYTILTQAFDVGMGWVLSLCVLWVFAFTRPAIVQYLRYCYDRKACAETDTREEREKKHPKRRKDYR